MQHTWGDKHVHKAYQSPCFSSALHDSREQMFGDSLHAQQKKNKSVCRANSSNQHFWALGMWTFGRRERGKEGMRLLGKGNCVREVKTVSRLQYMRFCHSNRCRTENIGLVCTTLSVASSFVVPHHGPNWRRPSVRFWKWLWPPRRVSADYCSLNCPLESCIQAKWGKWGKKTVDGEIWLVNLKQHFSSCMHRIFRTTPQITKFVLKYMISEKSCQSQCS